MSMYTTTCTRLVHTNNIILLGLVDMLPVVGVRFVPMEFTRLATLIALVTHVTLPLILFLLIFGIGRTLLRKHLALSGRWLLGLRMHGRLQR